MEGPSPSKRELGPSFPSLEPLPDPLPQVTNMGIVVEVIGQLENFQITPEILEVGSKPALALVFAKKEGRT